MNINIKELVKKAVKTGNSDISLVPSLSGGYDIHLSSFNKGEGSTAVETLSQEDGVAFVSQIEEMSNLPQGDIRRPRSGDFTISEQGFYANVRVSSIWTLAGVVSIAMRIMNHNFNKLPYHGFQGDWYDDLLNDVDEKGLHVIIADEKHLAKDFAYEVLKDYSNFGSSLVSIEESVDERIPAIHQMQVNPAQGMTYKTLFTLAMNRLPYGSTIFFGESETEEQVKYIHLALQKGFNVLTTSTDIETLQKEFLNVSEQDKFDYHGIILHPYETEILFQNEKCYFEKVTV